MSHRPTHTNTSWEAAKFEIVAHRWLHVGEPGYGVAVVNDATYGHDVVRTTSERRRDDDDRPAVAAARRRGSRTRETDQGVHRFRYAVVVGADIAGAIRRAIAINLPGAPGPGRASGRAARQRRRSRGVVVEAVKLADDRSGDVIVRLYEAHGGQVRTALTASFPLSGVEPNDLLERPMPDAESFVLDGQTLDLRLRPFEIVTLRLHRA